MVQFRFQKDLYTNVQNHCASRLFKHAPFVRH